MAKKQDKKLPVDGEIKPKKKGLFSFLRRKSKDDNPEIIDDSNALVDKVFDQKKSASKKTPATKSRVSANSDEAEPKKRGRPKKQLIETAVDAVTSTEEDAPKKKKRSLFGVLKRKKKSVKINAEAVAKPDVKDKVSEKSKKKSVKGKTPDAAKAPVKKRGRPKKNTEDINVAASETAEDLAEEPKQKKRLFGFLKRKKKTNIKEEQAEANVLAKGKSADISAPPIGGEVLQMELDPVSEEESSHKKKTGFFTKKVIIIIGALCGVSAATGAAAIVFAGPLLGNDPLTGLACKVAHKADFVLMKEKRVIAFIRSDLLPPKQRIEMLMSYTKFLEDEYVGANLITVSMLDTDGPTSRINFRGDNVGAQVVYAPDPLLSMATDTKWEVRYVNVSETNAGRFMGDRFTLSKDEIGEFNNDLLLASDCYMDKTEEELEAEELAVEEAAAAEEAAMAAEKAAADAKHEVEGVSADDENHAAMEELGFIDNVLGMVGLGGGDPSEGDAHGGIDDGASDVAHTEGQPQAYPGDKGPNADVMHKEAGFFDSVLSVVGLGGDDEMHKDTIPGVLGTRVKYN